MNLEFRKFAFGGRYAPAASGAYTPYGREQNLELKKS